MVGDFSLTPQEDDKFIQVIGTGEASTRYIIKYLNRFALQLFNSGVKGIIIEFEEGRMFIRYATFTQTIFTITLKEEIAHRFSDAMDRAENSPQLRHEIKEKLLATLAEDLDLIYEQISTSLKHSLEGSPNVSSTEPLDILYESQLARKQPKDKISQDVLINKEISHQPQPNVEEISSNQDKIYCSAYYNKEVQPETWYPLYTYIYRQKAFNEVLQDVEKQLGSKTAQFRHNEDISAISISEGSVINVIPVLDGFQFNPPFITIGFFKDWHRLDFEIRAKSTHKNKASNGKITFMVEGIIIADVPISIYVCETIAYLEIRNNTRKIYEAIFASYSHDDKQIVEKVERACKSLGLDYLRDVTTLKSGQHWNDEIFELIDKADIFQLFWSSASATSEYVRKEWIYALQLTQKDPNFIRPVYWEDPMPKEPSELSHLHFTYQPDLIAK